MVASAKFPIDYSPVFASTILPKVVLPVKTFAGLVPNAYQEQSRGFSAIFNGVNLMVCMRPTSPPWLLMWRKELIVTIDAYSGALIFVAFMAEMRHPMDFWKGMICAQAFICFVYVLFGAYVGMRDCHRSGANVNLHRFTATSASTRFPTSIRLSSPSASRLSEMYWVF
jgi:hypothetical protein